MLADGSFWFLNPLAGICQVPFFFIGANNVSWNPWSEYPSFVINLLTLLMLSLVNHCVTSIPFVRCCNSLFSFDRMSDLLSRLTKSLWIHVSKDSVLMFLIVCLNFFCRLSTFMIIWSWDDFNIYVIWSWSFSSWLFINSCSAVSF